MWTMDEHTRLMEAVVKLRIQDAGDVAAHVKTRSLQEVRLWYLCSLV